MGTNIYVQAVCIDKILTYNSFDKNIKEMQQKIINTGLMSPLQLYVLWTWVFKEGEYRLSKLASAKKYKNQVEQAKKSKLGKIISAGNIYKIINYTSSKSDDKQFWEDRRKINEEVEDECFGYNSLDFPGLYDLIDSWKEKFYLKDIKKYTLLNSIYGNSNEIAKKYSEKDYKKAEDLEHKNWGIYNDRFWKEVTGVDRKTHDIIKAKKEGYKSVEEYKQARKDRVWKKEAEKYGFKNVSKFFKAKEEFDKELESLREKPKKEYKFKSKNKTIKIIIGDIPETRLSPEMKKEYSKEIIQYFQDPIGILEFDDITSLTKSMEEIREELDSLGSSHPDWAIDYFKSVKSGDMIIIHTG